MGMAASQARLLALQARQSNLEYQGQQINQERTILSQQCTALYNSLLTMQVPVPPSTTDFQKVVYTGKTGATEYSFDATSVKPTAKDTYTVTLGQQSYGDSLGKDASLAVVDKSSTSAINGETIEENISKKPLGTYSEDKSEKPEGYMIPAEGKIDKPDNYFVEENGVYRAATAEDIAAKKPLNQYHKGSDGYDKSKHKGVKADVETTGKQITKEMFSNLYVIQPDGSLVKATASDVTGDGSKGNPYRLKDGIKYFEAKENGGESLNVQGGAGGTINGKTVFEINEDQKIKYSTAIEQSGLMNPNGEPYTVDDFYIFFDDVGTAHFSLKTDVDDGNNNAISYSYLPNGEFTKKITYNDAKLNFDPTNGRITEISIPTYETITNEDGSVTTNYDKVISYTTMPVSAETVTDEFAYQDAFNKYEYDTYLYDQKNKEINVKTAQIQEEDRNLELKLQRLDNERTQIKTEMEAVKKVVNDNIEGSYKTFSG